MDISLDICLVLSKDFCLLQPEKPWLVPTIQMKISKNIDAKHPTCDRVQNLEISRLCTLEVSKRCTVEVDE